MQTKTNTEMVNQNEKLNANKELIERVLGK